MVGLQQTQAQILPLRKTISRMTRENNELHARLIRQAEEGDQALSNFRRGTTELEGRLNDLQFLASQKDAKIEEQR